MQKIIVGDHTSEAKWDNPLDGAHWLRDWRAGEWLTGPVTPLFVSLLLPKLAESRENWGLGVIPWKGMAKRSLIAKLPWYMTINGYLYCRTDLKMIQAVVYTTHFTIRSMIKPGWYADWLTKAEPLFDGLLAKLCERPVADLTADELIERINTLAIYIAEWWHPLAYSGIDVFYLRFVYDRFVNEPQFSPQTLLFGYPGPLVDMQQAVWEIAERIKKLGLGDDLDGALAHPDVAPMVDSYYASYGHLLDSIDPVHSLLRENPQRLTAALKGFVSGEVQEPARRHRRTAAKRKAATDSALGKVSGFGGALFRNILSFTQNLAASRERVAWNFQKGFGELRPALLELGNRLVASGKLDSADQLFFLNWQEINAAVNGQQGNLSATTQERHSIWQAQKQLTSPPRIPAVEDPSWSSQGPLPTGLSVERTLVGGGASAGVVTGRARVAHTPAEADELQQGEILIAHATTPAMNSAISRAAAIVADVGGMVTHSSLIAREFGIPAVIGTEVATHVIKTGMELEVDGDKGIVRIL
ncbi:MAG: hypothetical protein DRQ52_07745 [Gammaproteobacteria bacterium]|nr:MAG: hypothetical protein DRQ52_07745 [Gammaproteobacteria bacterium]